MSYCRFRNTSMDFEDCIEALDRINEGEEDTLSIEERCAATRIYNMCEQYMGAFELMNDLKR